MAMQLDQAWNKVSTMLSTPTIYTSLKCVNGWGRDRRKSLYIGPVCEGGRTRYGD